jgi:hypothetical protein
MTNIGFMMQIGDKNSKTPIRSSGKMIVYTQTLNPRNLEEYVDRIAKKEINNQQDSSAAKGFIGSLFSGGRRYTRRINRRKR